MNSALCIKNYIRRWRHTRGYGVHSPLAFQIVKECIRPDTRYGFYCDPYLDFEYHDDRQGLRRARLIIRLLHILRPTQVWMTGADKRLTTAIQMIMPRLRVATRKDCPKDTDFIISLNSSDAEKCWKEMDDMEECGMVLFGKPDEIPAGVTLEMESKNFSILLRRTGMQKLKYELL